MQLLICRTVHHSLSLACLAQLFDNLGLFFLNSIDLKMDFADVVVLLLFSSKPSMQSITKEISLFVAN